jgi:hypothetical protein
VKSEEAVVSTVMMNEIPNRKNSARKVKDKSEQPGLAQT